jgi:hypothetical protein
MLIALPFFIIYIYKRNGFQREIIRFLICFAAILSILFLPYLYSNGYWEMVLKTRETDRIYTVFISYGSSLKLYVLPVIYIFSLYLFWRLNRITQDLFLVSVGIGFISIIVFLPPAPGWTLWIIPFISYYQIISKKDIILICLIYNFIYLINTSSFTGTLNTGLLNIIGENNFPISSNMLFTIQQCLGLLLAIRMYIYGLKKNNLYSTSNKSILTILNGNYFENIHLLINSFQNLIYSKDLYISSSNSIINDKKLQKITNEDFILSKTGRQEGSKAIYYANYMSDNISKIEQNLTVNKKPYQFILNDSDIDLNLLITKINIKLNINRVSQNTSSSINYDEIKNNKIIFDFKLLNEKSKREIKQYSIITYFPLGFLHNKLFNLFISIASLNVDIELINNQKIVKMEIEGFPSREDVIEIARSLIPEVDDLSFNENGWSEGYIGIMQIIFIANLSTILKNKSFL